MNELADYYAKRAPEYERIYQKPERQTDLKALRDFVRQTFSGRDVLEIACGTGYWTQSIAETAHTVTATDINEEVLAIARTKQMDARNVSFQRADAFRLKSVAGEFDAALAAFWWSHLTQAEARQFLTELHHRLPPGSLVVLIDNVYVEGSSTPISRRDEDGNTYQMRRLDDGSTTEVLKNFPTDDEIIASLRPHVNQLQIERLTYYWLARYSSR